MHQRLAGRVALTQDALRRAEGNTKLAEREVHEVIRKELGRRAARAIAASEATRIRTEAEYTAGRTKCNDQARLGTALTQQSRNPAASIEDLHSDLAASAEFAA